MKKDVHKYFTGMEMAVVVAFSSAVKQYMLPNGIYSFEDIHSSSFRDLFKQHLLTSFDMEAERVLSSVSDQHSKREISKLHSSVFSNITKAIERAFSHPYNSEQDLLKDVSDSLSVLKSSLTQQVDS